EKEYKKEPKDRLYPVYEVLDEQKKDILSYVLPVYGYGLWDNIWGYVAIQGDGNTVNGVVFDHEAETPGLGARITDAEIQKRYEGKHIYKGEEILGIAMQKGEQGGGDKSIAFYKDDPHKVDGMSGATITGNGITKMLEEYLSAYKNFLDDKRG
ncbi:MAG: NADH:ubiquinone reductase (Na(+)-transporting) subunit C, partial [Bacteroidota bacterium]